MVNCNKQQVRFTMAGFGAFANKRLRDVVFPGTHDAGIYGSELGSVVKAQSLSIGQKMKNEVRVRFKRWGKQGLFAVGGLKSPL